MMEDDNQQQTATDGQPNGGPTKRDEECSVSSSSGSDGGGAFVEGGGSESLAWLWSVYREMRAASRETLFAYFRGHGKALDLTPEILNLVHRTVKAAFPDHEPGSYAADPLGGSGANDRLDCALAASYLYFRVCEWELARRFPMRPDSAQAARAARFKALAPAAPDPGARALLRLADFHAALLHCAVELTAFAACETDAARHYPFMTARLGRERMGVSLWAVARSFRGCFAGGSSSGGGGGAIGPPLPRRARAYLDRIEARVLCSAGMAHGGEFCAVAVRGGGFDCERGDPALAARFFAAHAKFVTAAGARAGAALFAGCAAGDAAAAPKAAAERAAEPGVDAAAVAAEPAAGDAIAAAAAAASAAAAAAVQAREFGRLVAELLDQLLLREAWLFLGQPAAVAVAAAAYIMAKLRGVSARFAAVERAVLAAMPAAEPGDFARAEVALVPAAAAAPAAPAVANEKQQQQEQQHGAEGEGADGDASEEPGRLRMVQVVGPVRAFYNDTFLPAAEAAARAVAEGAVAALPRVAAPEGHPLLLRHRELTAAAADAAAAFEAPVAAAAPGAAAEQAVTQQQLPEPQRQQLLPLQQQQLLPLPPLPSPLQKQQQPRQQEFVDAAEACGGLGERAPLALMRIAPPALGQLPRPRADAAAAHGKPTGQTAGPLRGRKRAASSPVGAANEGAINGGDDDDGDKENAVAVVGKSDTPAAAAVAATAAAPAPAGSPPSTGTVMRVLGFLGARQQRACGRAAAAAARGMR